MLSVILVMFEMVQKKRKKEPEEKYQPLQPVIVTQGATHKNKDRKTAYIIARHFKNKSNRFSAKLSEDIHRGFRKDRLALNDYKLFARKQLPYQYSLLEGDVKDHYNLTSFTSAKSYKEGKENIIKHFAAGSRQV